MDAPALRSTLTMLRDAHAAEPYPAHAVRQRRLRTLEALLHDHADALAEAVRCDFGHRSPHETKLLEIFPSLEAARHARRHVRAWMKPQRRGVSLWFQPGSAQVRYQPLGVAGVIVPWNYPLYLAAGPLVSALAAGNRAMVKMSELTPATGDLFARLVRERFGEDEVVVVNGGVDTARAFASLPFDHLLFTGSTAVGRSVMQAAAEHPTPVTLELGGKSPAIVAPGYPLANAAERIMVGKCMNAGQTCIAPDYALVPAAQVDAFVAEARQAIAGCYPDLMRTPDYTAIVNERHFDRLAGYLDEAAATGARIVNLAPTQDEPDRASRRFPPHLVLDAAGDCRVMREEIFGPILPVIGYGVLDEAIRYVNERPRPLALYYFDHDDARVERLLDETVAGGVTINDTILHIAQDDLPFGGVGESGMGHYHGRAGFETFSKTKSVFRQSRWNTVGLLKPPYGKRFETLLRLLLR